MGLGKQRILYLCTGSACRIQMAEALTNAMRGDQAEAHSPGVEPKVVDPLAVGIVAELDIDISQQTGKSLGQFIGQPWGWAATLCDHAGESCPLFPGGAKHIHNDFYDPPYLAASAASEEDAPTHYRRVGDETRAMVRRLPGSMDS